MKPLYYFVTLCMLFTLTACGQSQPKKSKASKNSTMENVIQKPENPYYSNTDTAKLTLTDAEWKKVLPPDLYEVARHADTERAFTGTMWKSETKGTYYCAACGNKLFRSNQKFVSSCGWPSFFEQDNPKSIWFRPDNSYGMQRVEALCSRCDSHLGHLFDDGPEPTGKRYCMNAVSLDFVPDTAEIAAQQKTLVFGGGCFWCMEAVFSEMRGVTKVTSGYAGGTVENPSYEEVCTGRTGAAEVIEIVYNPNETNLDELYQVFFTLHDPTTLNRQGADVGTQYRSVIFYQNEDEKKEAQSLIDELNYKHVYPNKIVTTLEPLKKFWPAEDYHQGYFKNNKDKPYCQLVVRPKVEKFEKVFKDWKKNKQAH